MSQENPSSLQTPPLHDAVACMQLPTLGALLHTVCQKSIHQTHSVPEARPAVLPHMCTVCILCEAQPRWCTNVIHGTATAPVAVGNMAAGIN